VCAVFVDSDGAFDVQMCADPEAVASAVLRGAVEAGADAVAILEGASRCDADEARPVRVPYVLEAGGE